MKQITLYACKNNRKNSKSIIKDFLISDKHEDDKLKKSYSINDLYEVAAFCKTMKNQGYSTFRTVVYDNNFCVRNFYASSSQTIEVVLNEIYHYMKYMQGHDFDFTLSDLHNDNNIRFHINGFYHN